jgi:hypothetical protein
VILLQETKAFPVHISGVTSTRRVVIIDGTRGVSPTEPGTGVSALVVEATLVSRALRVDNTFRLALDIRVAHLVEDAPAGG